ncbi:conserved hypothetical protein [Candidatus Zixiibacteriota bacterium]|nr:conserved hypothetical protein [candidate division Zixibacteria bacterium]
MKKAILIIVGILSLVIIGCEKTTTKYVEIDTAPPAPQGVYSITGDQAVYLYWLPVRVSDLAGYRVYWSSNDTDFYFLADVGPNSEEYVDSDVQNGTTYFYAVTAYDQNNHESELSHESVFDTPRPEGTGLVLADANNFPNSSGYDFSSGLIVPFDNANADFYIDYYSANDVFYLDAGNTSTDLQDMGYTDTFDDISYSPSSGWSNIGWAELILGHTYIIWTSDNHYAKLRVTAISKPNTVRFDWGYQTATGNPELARPQHETGYLRELKGIIIK